MEETTDIDILQEKIRSIPKEWKESLEKKETKIRDFKGMRPTKVKVTIKEKEWNLSDKIWRETVLNEAITVSDVREFIRRLKEDYFGSDVIQKAFNKRVDKLAGKGLL